MPILKTFPSPGFAQLLKHKKSTLDIIEPERVALYGLSMNKNGIYSSGDELLESMKSVQIPFIEFQVASQAL
jgi:hypothetical protein